MYSVKQDFRTCLPCTYEAHGHVTMPHILNLANEVLYQIIAATSLHDIESFAATCRTFNALAESKVKRHRELKRKYTSLAFGDCGKLHKTPGVHPIYVLRDILQDIVLAQYSTTIRSSPFEDGRNQWLYAHSPTQAQLEDIRAVAAGCETEIKNAIYQCPFIEIPERRAWRVKIMQGSGEAIFGLLLTLLPHLKSMVISRQSEGLFTQMFKRIAKFQQPPNRHAPQALTKLARIDIAPDCSTYDMSPANEFNYLSQYALLPSMRTITGSHFQTCVVEHAQTFQWRHNPGISAVTEINIDRSTVEVESITNLLRGVRALERFSFSLGGYMPPRMFYQPRKIIRGLEQYAKCSLSYLHLTGSRIGLDMMQEDDLEYDLRVFEKLKQLRIDHTLLSHHDRPCLNPSKEKSDQDCNCWPQRLVDVLPASLESLKLMGSVPWKRVRAFLAGFPDLKADRLPRLREIEMQGSAAAELRFVHLCKKAGVVLRQNGGKDDVCYPCS